MTKPKTQAEKQQAEAEVRRRYTTLQGTLTERGRRLFAGSEALAFGWGGIRAVSDFGVMGVERREVQAARGELLWTVRSMERRGRRWQERS